MPEVNCKVCGTTWAPDVKEFETYPGRRIEVSCPKCGDLRPIVYMGEALQEALVQLTRDAVTVVWRLLDGMEVDNIEKADLVAMVFDATIQGLKDGVRDVEIGMGG